MTLASGGGVGDCIRLPLAFCFDIRSIFAAILEDPELQLNFEFSSSSIWKILFSSMLRLDSWFILVGESVTGSPLPSSMSLHLVSNLATVCSISVTFVRQLRNSRLQRYRRFLKG